VSQALKRIRNFVRISRRAVTYPRGQVPTAYGLDQPMPQRYVPQLIYPFVGDRIIQSTSDAGVIGETMRAPEVGPSTRP